MIAIPAQASRVTARVAGTDYSCWAWREGAGVELAWTVTLSEGGTKTLERIDPASIKWPRKPAGVDWVGRMQARAVEMAGRAA